MAITKTIEVDKLEIVGEHKALQVRTATIIKEDGTELNRSFSRKVLHPASDLYGAVPAEVRDGLNIPDGLFQLMAGSWNIKELLDDLTQAFK